MIPILYEKTETQFTSNGLGRLRDIVRCECTEERNGIYEVEFDYPVDGQNFDLIQSGRIIAVKHDETDDVQPFDIYSYTKPIDGLVTFFGKHISYRQSLMVASGSNINSLADAFAMLSGAVPSNPFSYWSDFTSTSYMAAANGQPQSVRQLLGGVEGSILDTYRGEYEWDKWTVRLWRSRGRQVPFTIRYGLNLLDYNEEADYSESYSAVVPFWLGQDDKGADIVVKGGLINSGLPTYNGRTDTVPLDLSDKFETRPSKSQLEAMAESLMSSNNPTLPQRTISVDFIRLRDSADYARFEKLQECRLCDSVRVVFPRYGMEGYYKIVKTVYDVLLEKYTSLELGTLSTSLSDALGISSSVGTMNEGSVLDTAYPMGSCYTTSSNTNPQEWLGGSWTLMHKRFKSQWITTGFTYDTTNTQNGAFAASLNGNTIEFRFMWQNKVAISDTQATIGTLDVASVGINTGEHGVYAVGFADALNAIGMFYLDIPNGGDKTLVSYDWVTRAASYPTTTGADCRLNFTINVRLNQMLDSFCDEFIWERTA
jgi:phage minor structural protein